MILKDLIDQIVTGEIELTYTRQEGAHTYCTFTRVKREFLQKNSDDKSKVDPCSR